MFLRVLFLKSKRRQYETMQEQLHNSEKQNAVLKKKLSSAEAIKQEFMQQVVEKEKQLQIASVHLTSAQVGIYVRTSTVLQFLFLPRTFLLFI
jgi:hypothetical protein